MREPIMTAALYRMIDRLRPVLALSGETLPFKSGLAGF